MNSNKTPNNLINETSPYLLQHAYNPVNWYPWCDKAFEQAKIENKPIFLSIGYSTCHWCHVMEKESFEDQEVADILNKNFISIKVDREERPDIDSIYMSACQIMTGRGGWPTTIIMTADQKPFFAGTYLPKRSKYGITGLMDVLDAIKNKWDNDKDELIEASNKLTNYIKSSNEYISKSQITVQTISKVFEFFNETFDPIYGGFGNEPKFPSAHNLIFLMNYYKYTQEKKALDMADKTLYQMYKGGIFDHIGGGFSRYSTDRMWLIPHFEKMLYDNALLTMAYLDAYVITKNEIYKNTAISVLDYVLKEMQDENGGFYCAQDADSDGEEGKYYTFTKEEIINLLGKDDGTKFCRYYNIGSAGNFKGLKSVPNRLTKSNFDDLSDSERSILSDKVYKYRSSRNYLAKDDKVLTSLTALMSVAFAKAYKILCDEKYLNAATSAVSFISDHMSDINGGLLSSYRNNKSYNYGHLDDYAFYIWALVELYECSFNLKYIYQAKKYLKYMHEHFYDSTNGGFFLTDVMSDDLIIRPKETYDSSIPSGNSVAAYVMYKLSEITADSSIINQFNEQLDFLSSVVAQTAAGHTFSLISFMTKLYNTIKIVAVIKSDKSISQLRSIMADKFIPNMTLVIKNAADINIIPDFLSEYILLNDDDTYYVCKDNTCMAPFNGIQNLLDILNKI